MAPRIKIHKDGRATLSGLNYQDLRSILTAAWLDNDASLKKAKKEKDDVENLAWYDLQLKLLDLAQVSMNEAIAGTFPSPTNPPSKAERWRRVRQEQRDRKVIDGIIQSMRAERKKA